MIERAYSGQTAYVVGRGPSLLKLKAEDFGTGPVLVLNHAILTIRKLGLHNPIYSLQKDGCIAEPKPPEILMLARRQSGFCFGDYSPRYVFDMRKLGILQQSMSSTFAVALAGLMGCSTVKMLAMDSYTRSDFRTVVNDDLMTVGRGYLHAAKQASTHAAKIGLQMEWVA